MSLLLGNRALARSLPVLCLCTALCLSGADARAYGPSATIDLANANTAAGDFLRLRGSDGTGSSGVPVAGGLDADGDGFVDFAMASMTADPNGRVNAGRVYLMFGDGTITGEFDSGVPQARLLEIHGVTANENAGSEIWMDDVTGDGLGDLLIARQNYDEDPNSNTSEGALTVLVGGAALATHAATLTPVDLANPPPSFTLLTLVGANAGDRLGIWMRTGDVTGDGIVDMVIGADQHDSGPDTHAGQGWLVRGGAHLNANLTVDLAQFGSTALVGHLLRIDPPANSSHHHLGATCQIADLDDNGTAEVLLAATLNRAGASLGGGHAVGGTTDGTLYIAWDDNFGGNPWSAGQSFALDAAPGTITVIDGAAADVSFGEEILGGLDYDADGNADLFVGDLTGDLGAGTHSGIGYVLFDAAQLRGEPPFDMDSPPSGLTFTTFSGGAAGDIAADTAMHGDFDCDGIDDLAFSSPHASPLSRTRAGTLHVFYGQAGGWPGFVDLTPGALPAASQMRILEVYGALGQAGVDKGDTLSYSGAAGDLDGDCRIDIITNEMLGNGTSQADTGTLVVIAGPAPPSFPVPVLPRARVVLVTALLAAVLVILQRARRGSQRLRKAS